MNLSPQFFGFLFFVSYISLPLFFSFSLFSFLIFPLSSSLSFSLFPLLFSLYCFCLVLSRKKDVKDRVLYDVLEIEPEASQGESLSSPFIPLSSPFLSPLFHFYNIYSLLRPLISSSPSFHVSSLSSSPSSHISFL